MLIALHAMTDMKMTKSTFSSSNVTMTVCCLCCWDPSETPYIKHSGFVPGHFHWPIVYYVMMTSQLLMYDAVAGMVKVVENEENVGGSRWTWLITLRPRNMK